MRHSAKPIVRAIIIVSTILLVTLVMTKVWEAERSTVPATSTNRFAAAELIYACSLRERVRQIAYDSVGGNFLVQFGDDGVALIAADVPDQPSLQPLGLNDEIAGVFVSRSSADSCYFIALRSGSLIATDNRFNVKSTIDLEIGRLWSFWTDVGGKYVALNSEGPNSAFCVVDTVTQKVLLRTLHEDDPVRTVGFNGNDLYILRSRGGLERRNVQNIGRHQDLGGLELSRGKFFRHLVGSRTVVFRSLDGMVAAKIWDRFVENLQSQPSYLSVPVSGSCYAIAFRDGNKNKSSGPTQELIAVDNDNKVIRGVSIQCGRVSCADVSIEHRLLVTGDSAGNVYCWRLAAEFFD